MKKKGSDRWTMADYAAVLKMTRAQRKRYCKAQKLPIWPERP